MKHHAGGISGVVAVLVVVSAISLAAQMYTPAGRQTLRGLPGVEVIVESLPPEFERTGLNASLVRADIEQRLRTGGVTIYARQNENPSLAKPYVYVHLNPLVLPGDVLVVAIQVHLRQTLRSLVTDAHVVNAMTWDAHNVVSLPLAEARLLRDAVLEMVDDFVTDWQAVH